MSYLSSFCLLYLQSGNVSEKAVFKGLRTCISNAILHFKCYFAIGSLGSLGLVHSILDVGSRFKSSSIGLIHSVYIIQYSFKVNFIFVNHLRTPILYRLHMNTPQKITCALTILNPFL